VIGGPQGFSATSGAPARIPNAGSVLILAAATAPPTTTAAVGPVSTSAAGSTSTASGTGKSSGNTTYGSRGLAIAMGIIAVGVTAMFVVV
jgi:hypothetical protein